MEQVIVIDHPLLKRDLTILRRRDTARGTFRTTLSNVSTILAYEVLRSLHVKTVRVQTPLEETEGHVLDEGVIVVPILRAGLGMIDGFIRFLPEARVGHLGMYRDETTHEPVDYYSNIPSEPEKHRVIVVDPMLATGGSAIGAISHLKNLGATRIVFCCLVAAPEGAAALNTAHPDVRIYTASLDRELDANAYIRPGLGDAGDRIFGTA
ncbi:MAG: uracil phosphoribosyltransferase [Bacteroidetes bacterium]|nr:MAG: uracil phosphoribosyltransferase [Bacteroidota bacterium]